MRFLIRVPVRKRLRVHVANANMAPLCGGGHGGKTVLAWQEDIGPANCRRCEQIFKRKNQPKETT